MLENQRYVIDHKPQVSQGFTKLVQYCRELGLDGAIAHIKRIYTGYAEDPNASQQVLADDFTRDLGSLSAIVQSELAGKKFRYIPSEKTRFCDLEWLADTTIPDNFPRAASELRSAGRCFAYGENTACAFHLNRVLEDGLKALAVEVGQRFDRNSWDAHLKDIERELNSRYKTAGSRTPDELFYSDLSSQFGHMKTAWRNPTMHIEAKYDEGDGLYLLQTTERFMETLCERGLKQGDLI